MVNADDFGLSPGVNAGVVRAHREGILTSATLLANAPFFEQAAAVALETPSLGVGLHLNIVRGAPLSPPRDIPALVASGGVFAPFRFKAMSRGFLRQAEIEYRRQFERILAAGVVPTHVDFEKHHAWQRPLYLLACRLAREYGVPAIRTLREPVAWSLRRLGWPGWRRAVMATLLRCGVEAFGGARCGLARADRLLGQTHIGAMDETAWLRLVRHLPEGVSEVMTHPGEEDDAADPRLARMGQSWIAGARKLELAALVSPAVREEIAARGVELASYRDIL